MTTPDKCPHCGARVIGRHPALTRFVCFSELRESELIISSLCNDRKEAKDEERTAHAETKRKLEEAKANASMWHQRYEVQKQSHEFSELAAKKSEARVAELERLVIADVYRQSARVLFPHVLPAGIKTLGQAMPGKEVV